MYLFFFHFLRWKIKTISTTNFVRNNYYKFQLIFYSIYLHLFLNLDQQPAGTFSLAESCSFLLTILMILAWFPGQVRPFESVRHARHLMLGQHSQQRLRDLLQRVRSLSGTPSPMPFAAPSTLQSKDDRTLLLAVSIIKKKKKKETLARSIIHRDKGGFD